MSQFYPLKIKEVIRETTEAVSLSFEIPVDLEEVFNYKAGQYITLRTNLEGKEIRRAYSLCSAPGTGEFKVTVKEVEGGKFSVLANNILKAGDILEVHPPEGKFIFEPASRSNTYAAFAAGSGITPVLSIIKTVLNREPGSNFILVYGNKSTENTIFYKELLELQAKFPERLFIEFIYSRTREENAQFGRIETSTVNYVLKNKFKDSSIETFYLCGPEEMITNVKTILLENGIKEENILFELFTTEGTGAVETGVEGQVELTITVDDEETTFTMDSKETVLDAALEHDLDVPYSCQGGICSSCIARITEGKAEMRKNQILTDSEIAEGLILTCQAQALTPTLKVDYDDV
ncbi:ferredoxin--NADP reductase [Antarcticibacterium flavum]|uniref:Ferredoxin--NADP reductase n=1 Tax=Antarcticibacterium flavum TaxID=2058175 RepID=A0A5B7X4E0_9FLAO|nr:MULTISPECIES: ferredoxin--NADP reductase [Antarcticibacterium]MCM4159193.1 flavodoxin reductase [Antarcticibacterium sp. W02-3]QCY69591.1 ferredoxin--NADP reductase [Antarcticibacterium flavum]